ncbi:Bacteriophage lambda, GpH, tail tape measure, N-terminal, partial [uncultured Caudovirales phage]
MADLATLSIKVDASGAVTTLDQLGTKLGQTEKQASSVTDALAKLGVAVSAGMIFKKFIDETSQAQFALAQLEARVKSTAGAAGQSVGQLAALAGEMQNLTAFSDEAVMSAEALLLTFTSINGEVFPAALKATADLATAMGTDLNGAALQLGKALQDPETGLLALRRSGISFSQEQIKVIKALVDTGHEAQAQKMILAELAKETGGSAAAAANTFGGAMAQLKNAFGELFEGTTKGTSALVQFIKAVTDGLKWLNEHQTVVKALAVTIGLTLAAVAIPAAIGALGALSLAVRANTVAWLESPYAPLVIAITAVGAAFVYLNGAYAEHIAHAKSANLAHGDLKLTMYEEEGAAKRLAEATAKHEKALADEAEAVTKLGKDTRTKLVETQREVTFYAQNNALLMQAEKAERQLAAAKLEVVAATDRQINREKERANGFGMFDKAGNMPLKFIPGTLEHGATQQSLIIPQIEQEKTATIKAMEQIAAKRAADSEARIKQIVGIAPIVTESEKEQAKIREQFMKQLQQTFANGIANMLENGLGSWRSFFDSIKSMFIKLVADFAAAKIMDKIMGNDTEGNRTNTVLASLMAFGGKNGMSPGVMQAASGALVGGTVGYAVGGMTQNTTVGALGGAAAGAASGAAMGSLLGPGGAAIGALAGGLAGLVTGFMGASAAAKKYAEDIVKQQNSLLAAAQAFVDRGLTGQAKIESEQNKLAKERDDLLKGLAANFKAGGFGKDGAANYQHTVEEIGFAYDRQKKALEATTKAAEEYSLVLKVAAEFEETNFVRSLRARELRAAGATEEADALDLFNRQVAEFADAVKK